jgi:8-oxo-dGTP pyrophosphatase MutT (NUDIX family)
MSDERKEELLSDHKFIKVYKVIDPEHHVKAYMYAERLGVDSVAFICYDRDRKEVLLNKEYKPPVNEFVLGAFGGSLDKDSSLEDIVRDEVREEAGFEKIYEIQSLGKVLVSTQMNQYCHLFIVHVDKDDQGERHPENAIEAMAETVWIGEGPNINDLEDWKAITIAAKAMLDM